MGQMRVLIADTFDEMSRNHYIFPVLAPSKPLNKRGLTIMTAPSPELLLIYQSNLSSSSLVKYVL